MKFQRAVHSGSRVMRLFVEFGWILTKGAKS